MARFNLFFGNKSASTTTVIDGAPGIIALVGVSGQTVREKIIDGAPGTIAFVGVSGSVSLNPTINGTPGTIALSGVSGQVVLEITIQGAPGTIALAGVSGQVFLELTINGTPGTLAFIGLSGLIPIEAPETNAGANLYIIGDNLFDDATLAVTSTASGFDKDNMQLDLKTDVWRSTDLTEQTITATWASTQTLSAVAFAFSNLHAGSTVQIKLYTNSGDVSAIYDSGILTIDFAYDAPYGFSTIGLDSFVFGGGTYFSHLFSSTYCKEMDVIVNSSGNPDGYMEISRIITGFAFTPDYGARYGVEEQPDDNTTRARTDAGGLVGNRGTISRSLNLTLGALDPIDRQGLTEIIRGGRSTYPIFASLYENSQYGQERQAHMIYGVMTELPGLSLFKKNKSSTTFKITEI